MATVTLASLESLRSELVNSKYYLNVRSGYMAPITLHCSYGDSGQSITFYIFDGGEKFDMTGAAASIHGTRRDGANFGPFACTVSGNAITFTLKPAMTAVEGGGVAEFTIVKNGATIGTCNFGILVENAVFPNGVAYDSDPSVYQDILKYVQSSQALMVNSAVTIATNNAKSYTDEKVTAEKELREANDTALSDRISNLVVAAGGSDVTEVVDARVNFAGTSQGSLLNRLKLFLEYDTVESTNGVTYG